MKIMKVTNSKLIHSFCNELNFNYKANNMLFNVCSINSNLINLYSYSTIIARRDLEQNTTIIVKKRYSTTTSKQLSMLRGAVNTPIVIFIYDFSQSGENNLSYLISELEKLIIKDIRATKRDYRREIEEGVNNLKAFLDYFKIDKRLKEYKEAKKLLSEYDNGTLWEYVTKTNKNKRRVRK